MHCFQCKQKQKKQIMPPLYLKNLGEKIQEGFEKVPTQLVEIMQWNDIENVTINRDI